VGFARRNFMVPIPEVASFEELNAHLLRACLADDQRRVDRQEVTIGEAWEMERPYLLPLPERDFECCVTKPVTLNPYGQVEFETNRYSVPADRAYRNLVIKVYPFRIDILHLNQVIASHPRCYVCRSWSSGLVPLTTPSPFATGGRGGRRSTSICWPACGLNGRTDGAFGSSSAS